MTLTAHIAALNSKTLAWVAEAPESRWACTYTEDLAHWHEMGIFTPAQFDHYEAAQAVYEMTKSVWGYKPSWSGLMERSLDELEAEMVSLRESAAVMREQEAEWQKMREQEEAYEAELARHEQSLNPDGELQFINGCWK